MSVNYWLVAGKEIENCNIGDEETDLARIMLAFEGSIIDKDFIGKIVRICKACGTIEEYEIEDVREWLIKNEEKVYFVKAV